MIGGRKSFWIVIAACGAERLTVQPLDKLEELFERPHDGDTKWARV
jgi:hypothetical protein